MQKGRRDNLDTAPTCRIPGGEGKRFGAWRLYCFVRRFAGFLLLLTAVLLYARVSAASIEDVRKQLDPATGKAKDTATAFGINGVVSAPRHVGWRQGPRLRAARGAAGVPILVTGADAAKIVPRMKSPLTGTLGDGPLGFAGPVGEGGLSRSGQTNKAFGAAEPRGADLFKGRLVPWTVDTFR